MNLLRVLKTDFSAAICVLMLTILLSFGIIGIQIFPFSTVPMFSHKNEPPWLHGIILKYSNGKIAFPSPFLFAPLSRHQLAKLIKISIENNDKEYLWLNDLATIKWLKFLKIIEEVWVAEIIFPEVPFEYVTPYETKFNIIFSLKVNEIL